MAAKNRNAIASGISSALGSINGSLPYTHDLTGAGQIENVEPAGPPQTMIHPYACYWLGTRQDIRDGAGADLSQYGQTLEFFVLGVVSQMETVAATLAAVNDLEADIVEALHAHRGLLGSVFDLEIATQTISGAEQSPGANGAFVLLAGRCFWARV